MQHQDDGVAFLFIKKPSTNVKGSKLKIMNLKKYITKMSLIVNRYTL
jgi:hypothetical protein